MKIEDYNKVTDRLELKKDCFREALNMIEDNKKHKYPKRKIIPIIAAAVVACGAVTGVFADEFMGIFKKDTNFEMAISEIDNSTSVIGNIETLPIYKAVMKKWDENVIQKLFAEGKTQIDGRDEPKADDPDIIWKFREYNDNTVLCYEDGDISFRRRSDGFYNYPDISTVVGKLFKTEDITPTDADLKGVDKKEAIKQADDIVNKLGIDVTSEKTIYSLDKEYLIKTDNTRNADGKRIYKNEEDVLPEWTEEQEAYLIIYNTEFNGIPVSDNVMCYGKDYDVVNSWHADGSEIYAIVSKNGIEEFRAKTIYEFTENKEQPVEICTAELAAKAIIDKFDENIPNYPTSFDNCRLVYHAAKKGDEYEMRPFWEFKSTITHSYYTLYPEKETWELYHTYFVDAETLEIFIDNMSY